MANKGWFLMPHHKVLLMEWLFLWQEI